MPRPHGGGHALGITDDDRERLVTDLEREPDLREQDLAERFTRESPPVSRRTVGRSLERLAITRKKSMIPEQQLRADIQAERAVFAERLLLIAPERIKVVDESPVEVGQPLSYGYSERGKRGYDSAPFRSGVVPSLVAWLALDGTGGVATHKGTVRGWTFRGFVGQHLGPHLTPGDVVIWDNARIHEVEGVRESVEAAGPR